LAFGLVELAKHPEFQAQLRSEIHTVLGADRSIAYDNMPLLNAFIKVRAARPLKDSITGITNQCNRKFSGFIQQYRWWVKLL
jgi:hypothetical protein